MKAYVQHGHGGPDACSFQDLPDPTPGPGEVVVRVRAAGLNRLDLLQREAPLVRGFALPHIAGLDVAGEVVAQGPGVTVPAVGDRVLVDPVTTCRVCAMCTSGREPYCPDLRTVGSTRPGGFAELVAVPADRCAPVPPHLDDVEAAALPVAYATAWLCVKVGRVAPGETVLVNGANAGVSLAAVQFAKAVGARVIGTARGAAKVAATRALGYDEVVEATDPAAVAPAVHALTDGMGVEVVIDHVGPAQFAASLDALAVDGRLVLAGTTTGTTVPLELPAVYWWGKQILGVGGYRHAEFGTMLATVAEHQLRPVIAEAAPFAELPRLLDVMQRGDFVGKLVVTM